MTIWKRPFLGNGALSVVRDGRGGQKLCLYLSNSDRLKEQSFTVAHELGHTFQHVYRNGKFECLWKWWADGREAFADSFARRWLEIKDNKQQLENFLAEDMFNHGDYKHHTVNIENLSYESF